MREVSEKNEIVEAIKDWQGKNLDPQVFLMAMGFGFLNITGQNNFSLLFAQLKIYLEQFKDEPIDPVHVDSVRVPPAAPPPAPSTVPAMPPHESR